MDTANLKTLDELAILHETDRASVFTRTYAKPHGYAEHYDHIFTPLRDKPVKMLEIGVAGGEGIKMWLAYFAHPDTRVFGVDNVQATNPWNTVFEFDANKEKRYRFVHGDQSDETFWKCFAVDYGADWDIIIDDGSHYNSDIITSFNALWPLLKPGGFYAVEDLGVAYGVGTIFVKPSHSGHIQWLHELLDNLNVGTGIDSIHFARELAIIRKAKA